MASNKNTVIAFDLYGTLLSTESIAKELAKHYGEDNAATVAGTWRKYQLEYTWRLNSMGQYLPFSTITERSLHHAVAENQIHMDDALSGTLLSAYDALSIFPDVGPALSSLAEHPSIIPVVFSNGTQSMVSNSVHHTPDLSPHAHVFKDIVTVEEVERFKPHPDVYYHLADRMGKKGAEGMGEMWLVSGNPFDVVGAKAVGMKAVWVDRGGGGWVDGLIEGERGRPDRVVRGLGEVVEAVVGIA